MLPTVKYDHTHTDARISSQFELPATRTMQLRFSSHSWLWSLLIKFRGFTFCLFMCQCLLAVVSRINVFQLMSHVFFFFTPLDQAVISCWTVNQCLWNPIRKNHRVPQPNDLKFITLANHREELGLARHRGFRLILKRKKKKDMEQKATVYFPCLPH